jgi:hypothetical protein
MDSELLVQLRQALWQQRRLYKTKPCRFHASGRCRYGASCWFAHTDDELREQPDLSQTKVSRDWLNSCCSRSDCKFAHGSDLSSSEESHERTFSQFTPAAVIETKDLHKQIQAIQDAIRFEIAEQTKQEKMWQPPSFSLHAQGIAARHKRSDSLDLLSMDAHELEVILKQGMPDVYFD